MKKAITFFALITLYICGKAQQGEIIYTEYNPDWCLESIQYNPPDSIKLDFDGDGVMDFAISMFYYREIEIKQIPLNGWEFRGHNDTLEADSLVSSAPYGWCSYPEHNKATLTMGVRKVVNDTTIYYGWFNEIWIDSTILGVDNGGVPRIKEYICVHDAAFCTIPNYPLKWGQTSYTGIEDKEGPTTFANLHPNPTNSLVMITGENLQQAEVFNMLGQQVLGVQGKGNELHIDMTALPAGVYFVTVTDKEGRKCVRKVMKE